MVSPSAKSLTGVPRSAPAAARGPSLLALLLQDYVALGSAVFLVVMIGGALLAPVLVSRGNDVITLSLRLQPPSLTSSHWLGTDQLGRDLLSRILIGARGSLATAGLVVAVTVVGGVLLGMLAGYLGGWVDDVIMRLVDVAMSFPSLLLVIVIIYIVGTGMDKVILVLVLTRWMLFARVARAETLRIAGFDYVEAARAVGAGRFYIMRRHILPNLLDIVATLATLELAGVILTESGLSFLGMGVQPPAASWGLLIAQGKQYMTTGWWLAAFPGAIRCW